MNSEDRHDGPSDNPFPLGSEGGGFGTVIGKYEDQVVDEALGNESVPDSGAKRSGHYIGLVVGEGKMAAVFVLIVTALSVLVLATAHLQIVRGERYRGLAEMNRSRLERAPVDRGIIYDRSGIQLVTNVPTFTALLVPAYLPEEADERMKAIAKVSEILEIQPIEIESRIAQFADYPHLPVPITDSVTHEQAVMIEIEGPSLPGLSLRLGTQRDYTSSSRSPSMSHLLGYQGRITQEELEAGIAHGNDYAPSDIVGKSGLEKYFEPLLRGQYGRHIAEIDAFGRIEAIIASEEGVPGQSLVMSLDSELQTDVENIFENMLRSYGKTRGSVVVMDPDNGDILAMISLPAFDNNKFAEGISVDDFGELINDPDNPLFHRAIASSLPSGSTFKLVVGAAALDEGLITPRTTVLSTGGIQIDKWFFPDWKAGGHGRVNIHDAIAESVNTFFYTIGGGVDEQGGLGVDRINQYASRFGLGKPLGIDLPGEGSGFLPSKEWKLEEKGERWYIGDTYHLAIGQGDILVTPLQIATMTAVFANDGRLIRPRMVTAFVDHDGVHTYVAPEVLREQVVSDEALEAVRIGMRQAVTHGSAKSLYESPVRVAGKTGTAQWSSTLPNHAWFTAFAPYEDPEIVVTVVVEEGGEGSGVAAQTAKATIGRYFQGR